MREQFKAWRRRKEWEWERQALIYWRTYAELFMGLDTGRSDEAVPPATAGMPPPQSAPRKSGLQRDREGRLYREVSADQLMALVESPFAP